ncbi:MAG: SLC13 family permease, partial [Pararhodobacter sp.]
MDRAQVFILIILGLTMAGFLWGKFRHDIVALTALLACVVVGVVPADGAFSGFGHPAVVTVACVLILSRALQVTGAVGALARRVLPAKAGQVSAVSALMSLGAGLSAFMNNVGALALLMPLAVQLAARLKLPPGQVLMPLAFATILGGMVTLVGTPPNLIVAGFRPEGAFRMFDFAWVGLPVALAGILFVALIGWRLVPARRPAGEAVFETGAYLTELRVPEGSKADGLTLRGFEEALEGVEMTVLALIRGSVRQDHPNGSRKIKAGDLLIVEGDAKSLTESAARHGIELEGLGTPSEDEAGEEINLREYAVLPGSALIGRSARQARLRTGWGVALLAISREGQRPKGRLGTMVLRTGDLLLLRGAPEVLADFARDMGCAPLDTAPLTVPDTKQAWTAGGLMAAAVVVASLGLTSAAVAFAAAALATMVLRTLPLREVYVAIDGPVIVLLAALI